MSSLGDASKVVSQPCASSAATDTWVVVPVYNEAAIIASVVEQLVRCLPQVVCIDDGSTDQSGAIAAAEGAVVLRHEVNLGQGASLQTGIDFALSSPGTRYIVTFDADGQHQADDALAMLKVARTTDVDVVLGSRFVASRPSMPLSRRVTLRCAVAFTRATTGLGLSDTHNGLRVFTRQAASDINIRLHRMAHASEILSIVAQRGLRFIEHPISVRYTEYSTAKGQSNLNAVNIVFDLLTQRLRTSG